MTAIENNKCIKLMDDAIIAGKRAEKEFRKAYAYKVKYKEEDSITLQQAQNHLGYAQGINEALMFIGFKHERMGELNKYL